jgi:acetyl esterase/lipase
MVPVRQLPPQTYASPGGIALRADLYLPEGTAAATPAIVWIHGGGWRSGSRELAPDLSRFFAERGFAMVAIDYRLSRVALFPAQIEDVRTAIRWLRSVAASYGIDSSRIGLWGASAGGHLAALAALAPPHCFRSADALYPDHQNAVQAVAVGYAPIDFLQLDAHRLPPGTRSEDPESLLLPDPDQRSAHPHSYESLLLGAPIATCPDRVRAANPIVYTGQQPAPFLILHGLADTTVPPHQSELLYDALKARGAEVSLALIDGLGHGFLNRTHLDAGGPRWMELRQSSSDGTESISRQQRPVFPVVEAFFRATLNPA